MKRRSFLLGLGASALAAPAVVRAENLMKIWVPPTSVMVPVPYVPHTVWILNGRFFVFTNTGLAPLTVHGAGAPVVLQPGETRELVT